MISRTGKSLQWTSALIVAALVAACLLPAGDAQGAPPHTKTKKSGSSAKTAAQRSTASSKSRSTRSTKGKRRYARSSRQRLAALHLAPERVSEIQQALIREGVMTGPPTGTWDESTRDAMRRYQSNNGFSATGLPDAKSLMKLGLGPHPLPESIQANTTAQTGAASDGKPNPN